MVVKNVEDVTDAVLLAPQDIADLRVVVAHARPNWVAHCLDNGPRAFDFRQHPIPSGGVDDLEEPEGKWVWIFF